MFHERAPPGNIPARSISDLRNEEMTKIANLEFADLAAVQPWDRSGVCNESILAGPECHRTFRAPQTAKSEFQFCKSWPGKFLIRLSVLCYTELFRLPSAPPCPAGLVLVFFSKNIYVAWNARIWRFRWHSGLQHNYTAQQNSEKNLKFPNSAGSLFWTTPHRWGPECHRNRQIRAFQRK